MSANSWARVYELELERSGGRAIRCFPWSRQSIGYHLEGMRWLIEAGVSVKARTGAGWYDVSDSLTKALADDRTYRHVVVLLEEWYKFAGDLWLEGLPRSPR